MEEDAGAEVWAVEVTDELAGATASVIFFGSPIFSGDCSNIRRAKIIIRLDCIVNKIFLRCKTRRIPFILHVIASQLLYDSYRVLPNGIIVDHAVKLRREHSLYEIDTI